jgi:predicted nucleotidyltransferase
MEARRIEEELRRFFTDGRHGVVAAYVFGSVARGEADEASDVDLAVLLEDGSEPTLDGLGLGLAGELEQCLGVVFDVVVLDRAPVDLVHRVLRDGLLVLDRDPPRRIRFEMRARREYLDLLPVLRRYRRQECATW